LNPPFWIRDASSGHISEGVKKRHRENDGVLAIRIDSGRQNAAATDQTARPILEIE
jgi:hypothetical protein